MTIKNFQYSMQIIPIALSLPLLFGLFYLKIEGVFMFFTCSLAGCVINGLSLFILNKKKALKYLYFCFPLFLLFHFFDSSKELLLQYFHTPVFLFLDSLTLSSLCVLSVPVYLASCILLAYTLRVSMRKTKKPYSPIP